MIELLTQDDAKTYYTTRDGETKLGEVIRYPKVSLHECLAKFEGKYIILGVPEDIGPRANMGNKGARYAWGHFLSSFLNIQANSFINSNEIMLLGNLQVDDLLNTADQLDANNPDELKRLRELVSIIDERLTRVIKDIVSHGKTPIVLGGGHNNAYGLISGSVSGLNEKNNVSNSKINVVNIDPHADLRALEGRHSGNPFSYAVHEELLHHYHIVGLHENYNSSFIINTLKNSPQKFSFSTFDDYVTGAKAFNDMIETAAKTVKEKPVGLEVDLDSISYFPSSAKTPSGWSINQIRKYISKLSKTSNVCYLHLTEAAPNSKENDTQLVGKTLTYFVSDFIKSN